MTIPKNWPSSLPYLTSPQLSKHLTAAQVETLGTQPSTMPVAPASQTPLPSPQVKIQQIRDAAHPANGQHGLFAARALKPGTFILPYLGRVHGGAASLSASESDYDLWLDREADVAVDAALAGNEGRFVNDYRGVAGKPNAEFGTAWCERWRQVCIGVWVLGGKNSRGIRKGEEILVSYGKGFWDERRGHAETGSSVLLATTQTLDTYPAACVALRCLVSTVQVPVSVGKQAETRYLRGRGSLCTSALLCPSRCRGNSPSLVTQRVNWPSLTDASPPMTSRERTQKPGAGFAFRPRDTLSCPDSSSTSPNDESARAAMVNERAPPKGPSPLQPAPPARANESQRDPSPDDDFDVTAAIRDFSSIKGKYRADAPTSHPTFGHPTKMVSSLKQKADIFIHQKSRPEHHLGTKISGPQAPTYRDRRPPPMPTFNSNAPFGVPSVQADAVFYTDPTKANADLKALLEGGLDEDEGQDEGEKPAVEPAADTNTEATKSPQEKTDVVVAKDGKVDGLKVRLLPHQVEGVNWMRGRELGPVKRGTVPKGGLLADDMGLGKTLQTISLMLNNQKPSSEDKAWKKHFGGLEKTTLVVAPLALIRQWEHELRDKVAKSHGLKVLVHHGPQRTKNSKDLALYDVVITTYQILVSEHGKSSDVKGAGCFGLHWWRIVLDEAHTIKNRNAKATKACYALRSEYRWCLSGTPMQNNLEELQSLVRFLRIRPYDDLKQWKEHIELPMKNGKGHIAIRRLHSILRCFMKRRTKEILKEKNALHPGGEAPADGAASATDFRHTERNVVTVSAKLPPAERKFYKRLEERADRSVEAMMKNKMSYANAFTLLLRLRQVCNHPKLVEGKLGQDKDALSTGASGKKQDADVDAMADMFAGMGIKSKTCSICGRDLTSVDVETGRENCSDCHEDLEFFKHHGRPEKEKKRKKQRIRKKVSSSRAEADAGESKSKAEDEEEKEEHVEPAAEEQQKQSQRRPRNRNAVLDSDDEEEEAEGSWLVPEAERGDLHLGKAGGEEDENAEGGGDWIGPEDSADDTVDGQDQSNLSSFIVDDEAAQKEPSYRSADEASEDEDSLLSVSAITQKMAAQTLDEVKPATSNASIADRAKAEASGSEGDDTDVYSSGSCSDSDSDDELHPAGATPLFASAKIREITRLLHAEAHEHKFIVFSQFTSMLDLVEPFLRKEGFRFRRYDGSMKNDEREESLRRLREDKSVRVLLCSLKCGSLGLNLTAATRVIIVEPFWNPFVEEQAIDRVHRLNQTVDVTVYKLTVAETVEARIIDLQEKKRLLAEATIEGGAKKKAVNLGLKEIIDLFRPGGHHADVASDDGAEAAEEHARARDAADMLRRKPRRREDAVYGRRW